MTAQPLDVLVVGGGITGAGIAHDAALRGLRVGLVEQDDFASGTSSRSSKMVHGGLRYLATGDIGLVRESLRERRSLQLRAPHLVSALPMLLPIRRRVSRMKYGAGLWAYDLLGAWRAGTRHRWQSAHTVRELAPNLAVAGMRGALSYQDAAADDVRLVISVLRSAVQHGALAVNGVRVEELLRVGGRVVGARVRSDLAGNDAVDISARVVINAAGVWAGELHDRSNISTGLSMLPSKGIHLTVPRSVLGISTGVGLFPQTGRNVFVEPWSDDLAIVGTSDSPHEGELADPQATDSEIEGLLADVNQFLGTPLARADVLNAWAGLRPLVVEASATSSRRTTRDLSREHRTLEQPGLVAMMGGKLTAYRQMAEEAVDAAVRQLGGSSMRCSTSRAMLDGHATVAEPAAVKQLADRMEIAPSVAQHLLRRYGSHAEVIAEICSERPELMEPLHPERPDICAEAVYAYEHELARDAHDVINYRTRLGIETTDNGAAAVNRIDQLLA